MRPLALFFLMAVSGGVFAMHEHDLAHWVENDTPMAYSQPVAGLSPAAQERFRNGRSLFAPLGWSRLRAMNTSMVLARCTTV